MGRRMVMKIKMQHKIQKALAVLLILACSFSSNLNAFADETNTASDVQAATTAETPAASDAGVNLSSSSDSEVIKTKDLSNDKNESSSTTGDKTELSEGINTELPQDTEQPNNSSENPKIDAGDEAGSPESTDTNTIQLTATPLNIDPVTTTQEDTNTTNYTITAYNKLVDQNGNNVSIAAGEYTCTLVSHPLADDTYTQSCMDDGEVLFNNVKNVGQDSVYKLTETDANETYYVWLKATGEVEYFSDELLTNSVAAVDVVFMHTIVKQPDTPVSITANCQYDGTMSAGLFKFNYIKLDWRKDSVSKEELANLQKSSTGCIPFNENGQNQIDLSSLTHEDILLVYECDQNSADINYDDAKAAFWVHYDGPWYFVYPYVTGSPTGDASIDEPLGLILERADSRFNSAIEFINKKRTSTTMTITATKNYIDKNGASLPMTAGQFKLGYLTVDAFNGNVSEADLATYQRSTTANTVCGFDNNGKCVIDISGITNEYAMLVYECGQTDTANIDYSEAQSAFWVYKDGTESCVCPYFGQGSPAKDAAFCIDSHLPVYGQNDSEFNSVIEFTNKKIDERKIIVNAVNKYIDQNNNTLSQSDGQFSFNLHYLYGDMKTAPADQTATNDSNGNVVFDLTGLDFSVGQAETAQMAVFQLTETPGTDSSIKYNSDGKTYYVVVGYDNAQTWYTVTYFQDMTAGGPINQINEGKDLFTNIRTVTSSSTGTSGGSSEYVPTSKYPAVIDLPVQKLLGGDTPDTTATFTFALKADNPKFPMPSGSSNGVKMMNITGAGSGEFGNIAYYQPGTYTYTCYEVNNNTAGYTYDTSTFTMKVVVVDAGDRLLATRAIVRSDGNAADGFAFGNWYTKTAVTPVAVTNTPAPTNPDVPKTADSFPLYLFILMLGAGSAGTIALSSMILRKSQNMRNRR
jgi:pilin isopeptide linkage protein